MDKIEQKICGIIDEHKEQIIAFGRDIWANGETGYKEVRTAKKFSDALSALNLPVKENVVVTGVKAHLKNVENGPTVALIGELDALDIKEHPAYNSETGGVHACGHHNQITAVMGAAIALSDPEVRKSLDGNIVFCGVPAEEGVDEATRIALKDKVKYLGGKNEWLRTGEFDEIDIAVGCHACPVPGFLIVNNSCNGFIQKTVTYKGKSAHSASADKAIDAQTTANIAQIAFDSQRGTIPHSDGVIVYSVIKKAGTSTSIVTDTVVMEYSIRGKSVQAITNAEKMVERCIKAACIATGAEAEIETRAGYLPWVPLPDTKFVTSVVEKLLDDKYQLFHSDAHIPASSDIGDVSQRKPVIQIFAGGFEGEAHSIDFAVKDEYLGYVMLAKALALTAYGFLKDNANEALKMKNEFKAPMTMEEYIEYKEKYTCIKHIKGEA